MEGRHIFYKTMIVVMTLGGLLLLWYLAETVIVLLGAIILASAIRPAVFRLSALGMPMGLAILLVYLVLITSAVTLFAIAVPPLFLAAQDLVQDDGLVIQLASSTYSLGQRLGYEALGIEAGQQILQRWTEVPNQLRLMAQERGVQMLQDLGIGLSQLILAFTMGFYWLTARDTIQGLMLSMTPMRHRGELETIFNDVERTLGDYVRGTAILMFSIGLAAYIGLTVLRVPNALALALVAGLLEAVPMVGAFIGAIPAVLVAFTVSPLVGMLTIVLFFLIQFLENNILVPRIMEHSVGLNPLLVLIAIVAGGTIKGPLGALLAIPVVGAMQVIVRHLVVDPMVEEASQRHLEHGVTVFESEEDDGEDSGKIVIAQS